jgi:hypothetical protein
MPAGFPLRADQRELVVGELRVHELEVDEGIDRAHQAGVEGDQGADAHAPAVAHALLGGLVAHGLDAEPEDGEHQDKAEPLEILARGQFLRLEAREI